MEDDDPTHTTLELPAVGRAAARAAPRPGLLVVWEDGAPACRGIAFEGRKLVVGRSRRCDLVVEDPAVSREHAAVSWAPRHVVVEDRGSRGGTYVDGRAVDGAFEHARPTVIRFGTAVALVLDDVGPFDGATVTSIGNRVIGPAQAAALAGVPLAARAGVPLLVQGESGTGKEDVARLYHVSTPERRGELVLVNTTNLPRELVEAELFGTRRGAYSGAVDRDGAIVRADRGTVFFDEIGDFELALQPKILRVVETRRVTPLGADSSRAIDVRFVCATHRDLDAMVAAGEFRQDLFVRLSHERVRLPPLRARREEIPWLVALALCEQWKALGCAPLPATPELIEVCCLRTWEGENVRGLLRSVGAAARAAVRAAGATGENAVRPEHVPDETPPTAPRTATIRDEKRAAGRATLRRAMAEHDGNVARAAEACGISLATAYRWLKEE